MIPLLHACIRKLQEQGMKRLFLDAVTSNVDAFKHLGGSLLNEHLWTIILITTCIGFKEWAGYRDVWRDI
jgi:hypothetical protein